MYTIVQINPLKTINVGFLLEHRMIAYDLVYRTVVNIYNAAARYIPLDNVLDNFGRLIFNL